MKSDVTSQTAIKRSSCAACCCVFMCVGKVDCVKSFEDVDSAFNHAGNQSYKKPVKLSSIVRSDGSTQMIYYYI